METMLSDKLLQVGRMTRPHGVKGECKVIPESDDPDRIRNLKRIWLGRTPESSASYEILSSRLHTSKHGISVLMQLAGIQSVSDVQRLRKPLVFAHLDDLPPLHSGEYYLHDLIGVNILNEDGEMIGSIKEIWETAAHPVYLIDRDDHEDALIPAVDEFIVSKDLYQRQMTIRSMEGLID